MTEYHKFLKDWTTARSITSFLGRDKSDFQRDWARQKSATVEERKPVEDKADIERRKQMIADEETRRKAKKEERKSMGSVYPKLIEDRISQAKEFLEKIKKIKQTSRTLKQMEKDEENFKDEFEKLKKVGRDKFGNLYLKESSKYFKDKYGPDYAIDHPTAYKDKYFNSIDLLIPIWEEIEKEIDEYI